MQKLSELVGVNRFIEKICLQLEQENFSIAEHFSRCLKSNLDMVSGHEPSEDGSIFLKTGDIPAMWLRDSACQLKPYLFLVEENLEIAAFVEGVLKRQISCILIDPYANAFNESANGNCWEHDKTDMKPELWERKFEIDSLCFPIEFSYLYWKKTGKTSIFDADYRSAVEKIVEVFRTEQNHEHLSTYRFERENCVFTDTLSRGGKGALVRENCGLIWSGFRPSDDACTYGYLIPSNMFASVILGYLSEVLREVYKEEDVADELSIFAKEVREAIEKEAVVPVGGERFEEPFYAYEVDGFGMYQVMDDANLPSLLSAPYFGYCSSTSPLYQATAKIILSEQNPYFYKGSAGEGIGSIHTKHSRLWHISLGMQGLVSENRAEKRKILEKMVELDGGTGWMHESIDVNDPTKFSRSWFGWANAIFAELVLDYCGYSLRK